jgi:AraC-like DNA-binding protein
MNQPTISVHQHDSSFGRWLFAEWRPQHLSGVVELMWYFEGMLAIPRERIFPDGRVELIVHLGPVYRHVFDAHTEPYSTCCIAGLLLRPAVIEAPHEPCCVLGIRLHPAGAYTVLHQPLHDFTDLTIDLADLVGTASTELAERCVAAAGAEQRLKTAAAWISARVRTSAGAHPAIAWSAQEIVRQAGTLSIADLRAHTGWSKNRFTTTFREQIGVAPKTFARIVRFRRALERVHRDQGSFVDIALSGGYYDQAHFNAEFRELSGFTPSDYLAALRFPGSASMAEGTPTAALT